MSLSPPLTGKPSQSSWPELLAALLSVLGVVIGILTNFHPFLWQQSGSDLKTLYASAAALRLHVDPYDFHNIAAIFAASHVVPPTSWWAHAPVYPPFTLLLLAPMTFFGMVPAVYLWLALSGIAVALAAFVLSQLGATLFQLTRPWRFLLIALFAASPLLSFALEMCNVSPLVAALGVFALAVPVLAPQRIWLAAASLAIALLLKPHLALWVVVALCLTALRADRRIALRALALAAVAAVVTLACLALQGHLHADVAAYANIVHTETVAGSMGSTNRELVAVAAQITSLASLLGFWFSASTSSLLSAILLAVTFVALVFLSLSRAHHSDAFRLTSIAAWSAFGLLATYHRAHDGIILLLVLPWYLARLRSNYRDTLAWAVLLLFFFVSWGPDWDTWRWLSARTGLHGICDFFLYRQSPAFALLLLCTLITDLVTLRIATPATEPHDPSPHSRIAYQT